MAHATWSWHWHYDQKMSDFEVVATCCIKISCFRFRHEKNKNSFSSWDAHVRLGQPMPDQHIEHVTDAHNIFWYLPRAHENFARRFVYAHRFFRCGSPTNIPTHALENVSLLVAFLFLCVRCVEARCLLFCAYYSLCACFALVFLLLFLFSISVFINRSFLSNANAIKWHSEMWLHNEKRALHATNSAHFVAV